MLPRALLLSLAVLLLGAGHDNNVEWNGVSHVAWLDRAPLCPINGEAFTVSFQTYHYDITSARVFVSSGGGTWLPAAFAFERGIYDVWRASIPASSPAGTLEYYIELTDGTDTDYLGPAGMSETPPSPGWLVDFATLSHAPLGATLTSDGGAVFRVWAPGATSAYAAGQFNNWSTTSLPMSRLGADFIRKVAAPVTRNQKYKYVFQPNTVWKTDARGRAMDQGDYSNTLIIDPQQFTWTDQRFRTPAFEDMIIYELHVGTFSGLNDGLNRLGRFRDVVDRHVDHLRYLGVNAVELMPITEFDYHESWGYNPINPWAPENAYGQPDDLKYLVDRLHAAGIAVLMDIVYNHFSPTGNFLWYYDGTQHYFDSPAVQTPWGSQAAFWKRETQDYFADNVLHWLDEYHADGLRMDATRYMRDNFIFPGGQPSGWALMQRINWNIFNRKADAISIAEELPNEPAITRPSAAGGAGFNSQWHEGFRDAVRRATFDAAYGDPDLNAVRNAIEDPTYPNKTALVRYIESHDEAAAGRLAVRIDANNHYSVWVQGRSKLAQGLTLLAPGTPMFLQGGEWLENAPFGSGWDNRIDWAKAANRGPIVSFFRDCIRTRRRNCGFRSDAGCTVHHVNDTANVLALHRWCTNGNDLVVVASFNNADLYNYRVGLPQNGTWYELLNSQSAAYLGNNVGNGGSVATSAIPRDGMAYSAEVTIPQMGLLVFRFGLPPDRLGDMNCDGAVNFGDINPFVAILTGSPPCNFYNADVNEDGAIDFGDINPFVALLATSD
ncbi:MAG: alpha-amylase family glycosyl hydrolase [Planctomycetota bacterium]